MQSTREISLMLAGLQAGKGDALPQLMPLIYSELRKLAARHLRQERQGHTLQTTALVNEAYLRLVGDDVSWQNRAHFFGIASRMMREILVEHARKRKAIKRGGLVQKVQLDEALVYAANQPIDFLALDQALKRLEQLDERQCRVVELRFFGGLSEEEIAEALGVAPRTVKRDWSLARVWLHREIGRGA